jgi:hypothetical protein
MLVTAIVLAGCGGDGLDPGAERSLEGLPEDERAAAHALVDFEQAVRDEDASALCRRVFTYEGSVSACERAMVREFADQEDVAIKIESVDLHDEGATARAEVTTVDAAGKRTSTVSTMQLVRGEQGWRVKVRQ